TVYSPGTYGDVYPAAIIGLIPPTAGDLANPAAVAVAAPGFEDDLMYVSDMGFTVGNVFQDITGKVITITRATAVPPSIKIFATFENFSSSDFFFAGELIGAIQGKSTKLNRPEGVALSRDGDTLYVVNQLGNSLEMFDNVNLIAGTQDLPPTVIIAGPKSKLNMP